MRSPLLSLLLAAAAAAKTPPATPADPCGDATLINQAYSAVYGKVVGVADAVTLLVDVENRYLPPELTQNWDRYCSDHSCKVRLVNLDAPADPARASEAARKLTALLKKKVSLSISPVQATPGALNALVEVDLRQVNQEHLAAGFATYREFGPYAVDWYTACVLKRAQDRAKAAHRGLWAGP